MKTNLFLICLLALSGRVFAEMIDDCAPFKGAQVGNYYVGPDYWNKTKCPGEQCVKIDDKTGDFTVVKDTFSCGYDVASYPNELYGTAWGTNSGAKDLPAPLGSLKNLLSDWTIQTTRTGAWDAAYDIWLCPDHTCGTSAGFPGGAEIMVWVDYFNTNGWQYDLGTAHVDGLDWEVWQMTMLRKNNVSWQYVAYVPKTLLSSVKNFDLVPFFQDSIKRGLVKPSWWLYAVQAGNEFHSQGVPFTSKGFSVTVNEPNPKPFTFKSFDAPVTSFSNH